MKTGIFPARKTQHHYALQLSDKITASVPNVDECIVFPRKHIKPALLQFSLLARLPHQEAKNITRLEVNEKRNADLNKTLSPWFVFFYGMMKYIEVCILFRVYRSRFKQSGIRNLIMWNGLKLRQRVATVAARSLNIHCYFIERGAFPGTTTLDAQGINYLNSVPRSADFFRYKNFPNNGKFELQPLQKNQRQELPERYIFVPFQVNTDSQITLFSPWIGHMQHLVEVLIKIESELGNNMPAMVLKTHPACPQDYHELEESIAKLSNKIHFVNDRSPTELIASADAVLTINSSVGMEGILADAPVIVAGQAFYDIPGLTTRASSATELKHILKYRSYARADQQLRIRFLNWLDKEYVVHGCWHKPDDEHFQSMTSRYSQLLKHSDKVSDASYVEV